MAAKDDYWSYVETIHGLDNDIRDFFKKPCQEKHKRDIELYGHDELMDMIISGSLAEGAFIPRSIPYQ